jgi:hypothetical protein
MRAVEGREGVEGEDKIVTLQPSATADPGGLVPPVNQITG